MDSPLTSSFEGRNGNGNELLHRGGSLRIRSKQSSENLAMQRSRRLSSSEMMRYQLSMNNRPTLYNNNERMEHALLEEDHVVENQEEIKGRTSTRLEVIKSLLQIDPEERKFMDL